MTVSSTPKPPIVLVADDDPMARVLTRETLEQAGLSVVEAENGRVALTVFAAHHPDVVVLDVDMPDLDGFAACAALRATPAGAHVPVLMVTGLDDEVSIQQAFDSGATDFATKPINWLLLRHRVRYLLRAGTTFDALHRSERKHRALLSAIPDMMFRLDEHGAVIDFKGGAGSESLGLTTEIIGRRLHEVISRTLARRAYGQLAETLATGQPQIAEYQYGEGDAYRHFETRWAASDEGEALAIVRDITERKRAEARVQHLAFYDGLTDLPNRSFFNETLKQAIALATRSDQPAAVLFIDLDRFKRINDTLSHRAGDQLLREAGERIASCTRCSDLVARIGLRNLDRTVARLGGDEFTLLLNGIHRAEDAALVAHRIFAGFATPFHVENHEIFLTCSIGIAVCPIDGRDAETLLQNADVAAEHAKELGGNRYQFYTSAMNATALEKLSLENRCAVAKGELELYYQPQVDLHSGTIVAAEALLRWHHPELGLVAPNVFISLAEETGLITPIGEWALRTACQQQQVWQAQGLPPVRVAVNLSARQFHESDLVETVRAAITATGLNPCYLELEITEGTVMANPDETILTLQRLKAMGILLAVDDFGMGYSSLSYLKRFPIDNLKIDRAFIRDLPESQDDSAIVAAIIGLSRALHLGVVAEGVETETQLEVLRQHGCQHVQGYLFAPPVPAPELAKLLARDSLLTAGRCTAVAPL